ncbi:hypothetical protein BT96DRAFT_939992 [Gymnopus androsaceus JB14]|uniref:F-box domain-containing protein n=1 Tax=Gymnopus androsaceus JB14 TaxID=1447944 RepID=A0A6A4HJ77_9AGAR|nr:hypothetical protein BT96DRAFT_939992 [Gymnopus androsaceus JB14]
MFTKGIKMFTKEIKMCAKWIQVQIASSKCSPSPKDGENCRHTLQLLRVNLDFLLLPSKFTNLLQVAGRRLRVLELTDMKVPHDLDNYLQYTPNLSILHLGNRWRMTSFKLIPVMQAFGVSPKSEFALIETVDIRIFRRRAIDQETMLLVALDYAQLCLVIMKIINIYVWRANFGPASASLPSLAALGGVPQAGKSSAATPKPNPNH